MLTSNEHSAKVRIWLEIGSLCVSVAQVGESSLLLASAKPSFRMSGTLLGYLIVIVDDEPIGYPIALRRHQGRVIEFEHMSDDAHQLVTELNEVPF